MMTTVLRDSLGGNCCTAMVATISPSADQLPESIATCRFAQRVAQISNQVRRAFFLSFFFFYFRFFGVFFFCQGRKSDLEPLTVNCRFGAAVWACLD